MKPSSGTLFGMSLACVLLAGAGARAESVPLVAWNYNWTPSVPAVFSDDHNSKVTLTNEPSASAVGSSDIVATNLKTFSTADPSHPDTFTHGAYGLALTLTDKPSGKSGTLNFSGEFNGTVSSASSLITNTYTSPITQKIQLGNNIYTVTMDQFTPPAPPGASNFGSISATAIVSVSQAGGGTGGGNGAPEPPALALAGLGLALAGLAAWRKQGLALAGA